MSVMPYRSSVLPAPLVGTSSRRILRLSASAWLTLFMVLAFAGGLVAGIAS